MNNREQEFHRYMAEKEPAVLESIKLDVETLERSMHNFFPHTPMEPTVRLWYRLVKLQIKHELIIAGKYSEGMEEAVREGIAKRVRKVFHGMMSNVFHKPEMGKAWLEDMEDHFKYLEWLDAEREKCDGEDKGNAEEKDGGI